MGSTYHRRDWRVQFQVQSGIIRVIKYVQPLVLLCSTSLHSDINKTATVPLRLETLWRWTDEVPFASSQIGGV